MRRGFLSVALLLVSACGGGGSGGGGGPPPSTTFAATEAFPSLAGQISQPMHAFGVPGANRIVVIQRTGQIKAFTNDPGVSSTTTILDISGFAGFTTSGEQGLLGFAFDPDFTNNRFFYIYYSLSSPHESVISRFKWDAGTDSANPASELQIITIPEPAADNHKGGMIAFGRDDDLYIAVGDGGGAGDTFGNGQKRADLLADILRIDVRNASAMTPYVTPANNPFFNDGDPDTRDEIWVYGLRNPFRFSFDRQGDLWVGDVGQDAWEEVDRIPNGQGGGNYGWCTWEGNHPYCEANPTQAGFTFPVLEYDHSVGEAVIGGVLYRGSALQGLVGKYVFGDYETGHVWAWTPGTAFDAGTPIFDLNGPVAFGEDDDGEILIVSLNDSTLFRITAN